MSSTFSPFVSLQLNASSQNSVSTGEAATLLGERSSKNSLRPGMTDCSIPNPMAPAQKVNLSRSRLVTQASLPIHCRGGGGSCDSSSSKSLSSEEATNATMTIAVDLERRYSVLCYAKTIKRGQKKKKRKRATEIAEEPTVVLSKQNT